MSEKKAPLYPCEIECLFWAANGKTAEETAMILGLSQHTVRSYRNDAIKKLDSSNITHAVYKAIAQGLLIVNTQK